MTGFRFRKPADCLAAMRGCHRILMAALCILLAVSPLCASSSADLVAAGHRALQGNDPSRALDFFKAAIMQDVRDETAWEGYRKAAVAAHEESEAVQTTPEPKPHREPQVIDLTAVAARARQLATTDEGTDTHAPLQERSSEPDLLSHRHDQPWHGLSVFETVDPSALKSPSRARRLFDEHQADRRFSHRRGIGDTVDVITTLYTPGLYKRLAVSTGATEGWSFADTQREYVLMSRHATRGFEFLVRLRNRGFPQSMPHIADMGQRTFLVDDRGNRYEPVRVTPPSRERLMQEDYYTVVFHRTDDEDRPITSRARRNLTLEIQGLSGPRSRARVPFPLHLFDDD